MRRFRWLGAGLVLACGASLARAALHKPPAAPSARMTVEVLDGCGSEVLAARAAAALRALGQDVVSTGDGPRRDCARTVLVVHPGDPWPARRLGERVGPRLVVLEQTGAPARRSHPDPRPGCPAAAAVRRAARPWRCRPGRSPNHARGLARPALRRPRRTGGPAAGAGCGRTFPTFRTRPPHAILPRASANPLSPRQEVERCPAGPWRS